MGLGTDSLKRSGRGVTLSVAAALAACVLSSAAPASATRFVAPRPAPRAQQAQVLNGLRAFLYTPNPANGTQLASLMTSVSLNDTPELRHGVAAAVTARLADFARLPADAAAPEAALAPAQRDARAVLVMLQAPAFQSALADQHRNMATFDAVMLEARRHGAALAPERSEALFQEALARARALEAGTRQVEAVDAAFEPVLAAQPRTLPRPSGLGKSARRAAADAPRMERVPRPSAGRRDERAAPGAGFVMSRRAVALMRQGLAAVFAVAAGSLAVSLAAAAFGPGAAFLLLGGVALTATAGGLLRKAPRFALANAVLATGLLAMGLPAVVPGAESLAASLALAALVSAATVAAFAPRRAASFVIATAKRVPGAYRAAAAASPAVAPFIAALLAVAAASSAAFFFPATPLLAAAAMAGAAAALAAPSLFLSRRAGPRAAGALAVGLAGAGLSLAMLNPLPLLAATAVAAGAYALKGAKPATLARGAAGVGAAAAGAAALGVIVAATPLGVLGMAAFLLAALGRVARMPRLSALAAAAAASTLLNYAVPVLFANSLVTVSALGFTALVPLGAMAAGVLGTAFVAVALTALRPEEAGAVAGRVVTRSAPLALVFSLAGAAGLLMGAPVLPLAGLAAAAYLFYRMPQLGPWKTLALSLPLIALGAGAEYLGAGAVFALALLWHEVLRPDGDAAGKGVLGVTV